MSKRQYRAAAQAKRLSPDDIALARSFGGPIDYSQAEYLAADKAYDAAKTDPAMQQQQLHDQIQHQQRMLRILGSAL